jgi:hypothetical protein
LDDFQKLVEQLYGFFKPRLEMRAKMLGQPRQTNKLEQNVYKNRALTARKAA